MGTDRTEPTVDRVAGGRAGTLVLGLAYVVVGIGFFYSLVADSMALFVAVLLATAVLVIVSLGISFRRDGILTAENKLIGGFVLVAMGLLGGLSAFTTLPHEGIVGIVVLVGVVVPWLLLQYTEYGTNG